MAKTHGNSGCAACVAAASDQGESKTLPEILASAAHCWLFGFAEGSAASMRPHIASTLCKAHGAELTKIVRALDRRNKSIARDAKAGRS